MHAMTDFQSFSLIPVKNMKITFISLVTDSYAAEIRKYKHHKAISPLSRAVNEILDVLHVLCLNI